MNKKILAFICVLLTLLTGCVGKDNTPYNQQIGYKEYISDSNTGYEDLPYFDCDEAMESSEGACDYYKNNKRRRGSFIITDYEDGVCINRYVGRKLAEDEVLEIPEELDGKPVIKIGGYPQKVKEDYGEDGTEIYTEVWGAFAGNTDFTLKIPSTVKIIGCKTFLYYSGMIPEESRNEFTFVKNVVVSEDNPYYSSYEGALYSKDKKELLFDHKLGWMYYCFSYTVPDFVEVFEPINGVNSDLNSITFGENIKEINTYIDKGEDGIDPDPDMTPYIVKVRGYKNTVAEEWAKEQYAEFEAIG